MPMPQYFLHRQSSFCLSGRYYIVLNLLKDKYLRIDKSEFEALAAHIALPKTFVRVPAGPERSELGSQLSGFISELHEQGVLTTDAREAWTDAPRALDLPATSVSSDMETPATTRCLKYVPAFFSAVTAANRSLSHTTIAETVQHVANRKRQREKNDEPSDIEKVRFLIAVFLRLRPFYPRKYLCLFDSLALLNFLAHFDIFPVWVFAVQSEPFAAHCWVQDGSQLFNETIERASLYTPVLEI